MKTKKVINRKEKNQAANNSYEEERVNKSRLRLTERLQEIQ